MLGFALALVVPTEPIGFLGWCPLMLGVWKACEFGREVFEKRRKKKVDVEESGSDTDDGSVEGARDSEDQSKILDKLKSVGKVALITLINGGDNVGVYTPLFSQAKSSDLAVYIVVYYILLAIWCLVAWLVMGQKYALKLVQKCVDWVLPLLYVGLGVFILVSSECYPWAVREIDEEVETSPGKVVLGLVTMGVVGVAVAGMVWRQVRKLRSGKEETGEDAMGGSCLEGVEEDGGSEQRAGAEGCSSSSSTSVQDSDVVEAEGKHLPVITIKRQSTS